MTQTPVLSVGEPREVLAYIPFRIGFHPRDALVVLTLRGPRRRLGMVLRYDLSPPDAPGDYLGWVARSLAGHARRDEASAVLLVGYRDGDPAGAAALLREVAAVVTGCGVDVWHAWHVGDGRYRPALCDDERCCPPGGLPLGDLRDSAVAAEMVGLGATVVPDRELLVADVEPDSAEVQAEADAARRARAGQCRRSDDQARRTAALRRWQAVLATAYRIEKARDGDGPEHPTGADADQDDRTGSGARWCGAMAADLEDVVLRDAVMLTLVDDAGAAPLALAACDRSSPLPAVVTDALAAVFDDRDGGAHAAVPDAALVRAGGQVLAAVARSARPGHRAPALGLLGWLAWFGGDGTRARMLCERAEDDRPGYSLAELVLASLDRGVAPAWVTHSRHLDGCRPSFET